MHGNPLLRRERPSTEAREVQYGNHLGRAHRHPSYLTLWLACQRSRPRNSAVTILLHRIVPRSIHAISGGFLLINDPGILLQILASLNAATVHYCYCHCDVFLHSLVL